MYLFTGGAFLDPRQDELRHGVEVLVEGERVREVSDRPIRSEAATRVDIGDRTLMPGLIDAHVHAFLPELNIGRLMSMPLTLLGVEGAAFLRRALHRGFTTVRDTGGADSGIREACERGLIEAPRLFIAGASISQTGGHADFRSRTQRGFQCYCCSGAAYVSRIADGVPEVIRAARDELRKGADFLKIMVSGGVASESDPLESLQFRVDEIEAAVEEAERWGSYVAAHAYSGRAIERAVRAGVRTIEHGNMIDDARAELMAQKGAFLIANLVAYDAMRRRGEGLGMSAYGLAKNQQVLEYREAVAGDRAPGWGEDRVWERFAGGAGGGAVPRVPAARGGAAGGRDHPLGDDCRGGDRAAAGRAWGARSGRVCGFAGGGRRSATGSGRVSERGAEARRDHEGGRVRPEPFVALGVATRR